MTPLSLLALSTVAWAEPAPPPAPAPAPAPVVRVDVRAYGDDLAGARAAWASAAGDQGTADTGSVVATFATRTEALAFAIETLTASSLPWAPPQTTDVAAPTLADEVRRAHGVRVHGFSITSEPDAPWPSEPHQWLPPEAPWHRGTLAATSAPLFAAPAPRLPSAGQSHARVERDSDVFELGHVDRCDEAGTCLRWSQIVTRDGDAFTGGYVPAYLFVPRADWVPSATDLPRAQLRPSTLGRGEATWVLWVRLPDGTLHQHTLTVPTTTPDRWPAASLTVDGTTATVELGQTQRQLVLDASLDARPEDL